MAVGCAQRPGGLGSPGRDLLGEAGGPRTSGGLPPAGLDDVPRRRLRQHTRHVEPCPLESPEPASGWLRSAAAVPEEEPRAPERPGAGRDPQAPTSAPALGEEASVPHRPPRGGAAETGRAPVPDRRSWRSHREWRGVGPWGAQGRRPVGWSLTPRCSRQTMGCPARQAWCEPGPHVRRPLGHGHCGACAAAAVGARRSTRENR
jgi:hypothetical protein